MFLLHLVLIGACVLHYLIVVELMHENTWIIRAHVVEISDNHFLVYLNHMLFESNSIQNEHILSQLLWWVSEMRSLSFIMTLEEVEKAISGFQSCLYQVWLFIKVPHRTKDEFLVEVGKSRKRNQDLLSIWGAYFLSGMLDEPSSLFKWLIAVLAGKFIVIERKLDPVGALLGALQKIFERVNDKFGHRLHNEGLEIVILAVNVSQFFIKIAFLAFLVIHNIIDIMLNLKIERIVQWKVWLTLG